MTKAIIFLLCMFTLLTGCATDGTNKGPSLSERLKTAKQALQLINAENSKSCDIASKCEYLGELFCDLDGENSSNDVSKVCDKKVLSKAVQYGGDTFVLQKTGKVDSSIDYYRTFGQLYSCTGANKQLHLDYKKEHHLDPLGKLTLVTKKYSEQCHTTQACTLDKAKWSCGSMQGDPYRKCREKFERNAKLGSKVNHMVYKGDRVNGAGFYRLYIESYACR